MGVERRRTPTSATIFTVAMLVGSWSVPFSLQAQESTAGTSTAGDTGRLGEVVVTARRVEESLQQAPVSVLHRTTLKDERLMGELAG